MFVVLDQKVFKESKVRKVKTVQLELEVNKEYRQFKEHKVRLGHKGQLPVVRVGPCPVLATITSLDTSGSVGKYTSVTIGADGLGLISYYDATNNDLKVSHCSNTACTAATITSLDTSGVVGFHTSVTIGTDGLGLISYYEQDNGDLKVFPQCNTFRSPYFRRRR
jgi:hypothetical protein